MMISPKVAMNKFRDSHLKLSINRQKPLPVNCFRVSYRREVRKEIILLWGKA